MPVARNTAASGAREKTKALASPKKVPRFSQRAGAKPPSTPPRASRSSSSVGPSSRLSLPISVE